MGDGGLGGSVAVLGSGLLCEQIRHQGTRTCAVLKLLRVDSPLDAEFPHFLREPELTVQLLD